MVCIYCINPGQSTQDDPPIDPPEMHLKTKWREFKELTSHLRDNPFRLLRLEQDITNLSDDIIKLHRRHRQANTWQYLASLAKKMKQIMPDINLELRCIVSDL